MGNTDIKAFPPLCGGVFFTILKPYRSDRISPQLYYDEIKDPKSDIPTLIELIGVVKPDFLEKKNLPSYGSIKSYTSKFLNCRESVPNGLEIGKPGYIASFNAQMDDSYRLLLCRMHGFLDQSIGMRNKDGSPKTAELTQLVREIIEIMENDPACADVNFRIGKDGESMKLSEIKTVYFQSFILGIWHYIVASQIENKLKESLYDDWHNLKNRGTTASHRFKLVIQDINPADGMDGTAPTAPSEDADDIEVVTGSIDDAANDSDDGTDRTDGSNEADDSSQNFKFKEEKDENGNPVKQTLFYNAGEGTQIETVNGGLTLHIGK